MKAKRDCRVYAHRRETDGRIFYIGKGKFKRPYEKKSRSEHWKRIVAKNGITIEIVKDWSPDACCQTYERILIFLIGRKNLCNQTDGGDAGGGRFKSKYQIKLTSERLRKLWQDPEYRKTMTKKGSDHHRTGVKLSDETVAKIKSKLTGRKMSEEFKAKIANAMKGRVFKESSKKLLSYSKQEKTIYRFTHPSGEIFIGMRNDFIKKYGLDPSPVAKMLKGKAKSVKGWRLENET